MEREEVDDDTERVEVGDDWGKGWVSIGAQVSTGKAVAEAGTNYHPEGAMHNNMDLDITTDSRDCLPAGPCSDF